VITWGQSDDPDSDWLAAATLAEAAIAATAPHSLVIVTALCWGLDLRQLADRPGPVAALHRRKLVFTTHIYTFSFWWMQVRSAPELPLRHLIHQRFRMPTPWLAP
jgi:hypothetical protein